MPNVTRASPGVLITPGTARRAVSCATPFGRSCAVEPLHGNRMEHTRPGEPEPLRVGYLVSRYPLPTHAFIEREIEALRELGVEIHVFGIHRAEPARVAHGRRGRGAPHDVRGAPRGAHPARGRARGGARAAAPRVLRTLAVALALPGGRHGRITQLFYFGEAVPIWREAADGGCSTCTPTSRARRATSRCSRRSSASAREPSRPGASRPMGPTCLTTCSARLAEKIRRATFVVCVSDVGRSLLMRLVSDREWPKIEVVRCGLDARWHAIPPMRGGPRRTAAGADGRTSRARERPRDPLRRHRRARATRRARAASRSSAMDRGASSCAGVSRSSASHIGCASPARSARRTSVDRYAAADVFCLASLSEGLPVVLMEAMSAGLPIIATRIMGIPELVEHGTTGLLVSPGVPTRSSSPWRRWPAPQTCAPATAQQDASGSSRSSASSGPPGCCARPSSRLSGPARSRGRTGSTYPPGSIRRSRSAGPARGTARPR